jgi:hypothetical protein
MWSAGFFGLFGGRFLKPLLIGSSLMLFQQITGQPSVLYYAAGMLTFILRWNQQRIPTAQLP